MPPLTFSLNYISRVLYVFLRIAGNEYISGELFFSSTCFVFCYMSFLTVLKVKWGSEKK